MKKRRRSAAGNERGPRAGNLARVAALVWTAAGSRRSAASRAVPPATLIGPERCLTSTRAEALTTSATSNCCVDQASCACCCASGTSPRPAIQRQEFSSGGSGPRLQRRALQRRLARRAAAMAQHDLHRTRPAHPPHRPHAGPERIADRARLRDVGLDRAASIPFGNAGTMTFVAARHNGCARRRRWRRRRARSSACPSAAARPASASGVPQMSMYIAPATLLPQSDAVDAQHGNCGGGWLLW